MFHGSDTCLSVRCQPSHFSQCHTGTSGPASGIPVIKNLSSQLIRVDPGRIPQKRYRKIICSPVLNPKRAFSHAEPNLGQSVVGMRDFALNVGSEGTPPEWHRPQF